MKGLYIALCACVVILSSLSPLLTSEDRKKDIESTKDYTVHCEAARQQDDIYAGSRFDKQS